MATRCLARARDAFGDALIPGRRFEDANGWGDHDNYGTIASRGRERRRPQGRLRALQRPPALLALRRRWFRYAHRRPAHVGRPAAGVNHVYNTAIRVADVTGDGLADVCARSSAGVELLGRRTARRFPKIRGAPLVGRQRAGTAQKVLQHAAGAARAAAGRALQRARRRLRRRNRRGVRAAGSPAARPRTDAGAGSPPGRRAAVAGLEGGERARRPARSRRTASTDRGHGRVRRRRIRGDADALRPGCTG
jgi:hypothetical protein